MSPWRFDPSPPSVPPGLAEALGLLLGLVLAGSVLVPDLFVFVR